MFLFQSRCLNFGENMSILDVVAYHIWAFVVAARGSRSRGHFWSPARCRISVFEILPLGGVKLVSLAIIWEEICIFFRIWDKILEVSALFLSRYCWLCYGISFQWSAKGTLFPQTRLGFSKKKIYERVLETKQLPGCSLSSLSRVS